ncbi:hypothetical protein OPS25_10815 [Alteromonas ponticola]|uniref:Uncharacterized protein n=1 Tax=Alteromonas aquimaris TaxID=2998417 RepID=A0ABT3P882_9ALTE|nr:hypothetical protein [Alteromonas aquimaris]MCW8108985.1 hypothetical protein [Alteromonas aquimaris]
MKVFLIAALALSVIFNLYQLSISQKPANLLIANSSQAECIKNLRSSTSEADIIGPEFLSGYKALNVSLNSKASFSEEVSGCYFDSYFGNVTVENLADKVRFLRSTGSNSITFFKDANSNEFIVYGKSK